MLNIDINLITNGVELILKARAQAVELLQVNYQNYIDANMIKQALDVHDDIVRVKCGQKILNEHLIITK